MQKSTIWAGYVRLSRDDKNGNLESMSIANQKQIIKDYAIKKGCDLVKIYSDDGYSGTNFDRPAFKELIRDIEGGLINGVMTKDLSRLGRNYSMTGYYLDEYFPEKNVRFVAINDGVDTFEDHDDFSAFHNVINEYYPREVSRKVRQVKKKSCEQGKFMGSQAPYGYMKSPDDKHRLIIDEYPAAIVRRVYQEFLAGESGRAIADRLNSEGILNPRQYHYQQRGKENPLKQSMSWGSGMIMSMLRNRVYTGDLIQGKRQVISFKTKKRRQTNPDEWIVVENTHEPIISREEWKDTQKLLHRKIRRKRTKENRPEAILTGLVFCCDCGASMSAALIGKREILNYRCNKYVHNGSKACTSHSIPAEVLEQIVLNDIKAYAVIAQSDRERMIDDILASLNKEHNGSLTQLKKEIQTAESKINEISAALKSLYGEKITGKMPERIFYSLLSDYEKEMVEWEERLLTYREAAEEQESNGSNVDDWVTVIGSALDMERLTRPLAMALVDRIIVSERSKHGGASEADYQDVEIVYKFVGDLGKVPLAKEKSIA